MSELNQQLGRSLRSAGLGHLAFCDRDRVRLFPQASAEPGHWPGEPASRQLARAGRQLFYLLEESAPDFAALRTGSVVRTVVRVPAGAILYQSVAPDLHLCCAGPGDRVDELVALMTEGVDRLRPAVRHSVLSRHVRTNAVAHAAPPPSGDDGRAAAVDTPCVVETSADPDDDPEGRAGLLSAALGVHGLHYVAYFTGGTPSCTADIFRHPTLCGFSGSATPQQRRDRFCRLGQLLPGVTGRMNTSLHALLEGEIQQIVLNVGQGTVYFHHLHGQRYLLGVSLSRSRPAETDRHIERLGRQLTTG
ncbi:hypothetical protein ACWDQL_20190 [Streptomyces olivaceus]